MDIHFSKPSIGYLRDEFSEEACNILYDQELDKNQFTTATGFIPTMRIKKFKPSKPELYGITDDNKEMATMCYIDKDSENKKMDILFSNEELDCTKGNTIFNNDIITDVFEDNKPDRNQNFAFNKCVFKVDNSKVNTDSLNTFWNKMGKAECDALFADVRKENKEFEQQLDKLLKDYQELSRKVKLNQSDILSKKGVISELSKERDTLIEKSNFISNNLKRIVDSFEIEKRKLAQMKKDYETVIQDYNDKMKTLSTNKQQLNDLQESLKLSFQTLTKQYKQLQQEFAVLTTAYDVLYSSYLSLKKQNEKLKADLQSKNDEYKSKKGAFDLCQYQLNQCLNRTQSDVNSLKYRIYDCKNEIKRKTIERDNLQKTKEDLDNELKLARSEEQRTKIAYETCNSERIQKQSLTTELQNIIDNWKKNRFYCDDYDKAIDSVANEIYSTVSLCQTYTDLDKFTLSLNKQDLEKAKQNAENTCKVAPPAKYSIDEFYKNTLFYYQGAFTYTVTQGTRTATRKKSAHDIKTNMIGTFAQPIAIGYNWRNSLSGWFLQEAADVVKTWAPALITQESTMRKAFNEANAWKGIIPIFSSDLNTGSAPETVYIAICPLFFVSKQVTGFIDCVADDEAFFYINGKLIGKTNNAGVRYSDKYTFNPYTPYVLVIVHVNGGGTGEIKVEKGFNEVIDYMIKTPNDVKTTSVYNGLNISVLNM